MQLTDILLKRKLNRLTYTISWEHRNIHETSIKAMSMPV